MAVHSIQVSYHPEAEDSLHGFELFSPVQDGRYDGHHIRLDGWALAKRGSVHRLQLMHGPNPWRSIPVTLSCDKAEREYPDAKGRKTCGFRSSFGTIGLPPQFSISVLAVLRNGRRLHCATIRGQREPIETSYVPTFNPLMLTSLARTGTTRLMQTLNLHPAIALDGNYPFEARPGCYWLHMIKVLSEPSLGKNTFEADLNTLPPCPMNSELISQRPHLRDWFEGTYVNRNAEFAQRNIDELYERIAQDCGKAATAMYFAEKSLPCHLQWIAGELYPAAKEIVLIRDFRDMVCSMIAFNRKRGFATFGRETVESDADFIRLKQFDARRLMDVVSKRHARVHLVRYEQLVTDPSTTIREICEYLGVPSDDALMQRIVSSQQELSTKLDFHRTTKDEHASIGRWRADLDPRLQALCNEVFAESLAEAGYEI